MLPRTKEADHGTGRDIVETEATGQDVEIACGRTREWKNDDDDDENESNNNESGKGKEQHCRTMETIRKTKRDGTNTATDESNDDDIGGTPTKERPPSDISILHQSERNN